MRSLGEQRDLQRGVELCGEAIGRGALAYTQLLREAGGVGVVGAFGGACQEVVGRGLELVGREQVADVATSL